MQVPRDIRFIARIRSYIRSCAENIRSFVLICIRTLKNIQRFENPIIKHFRIRLFPNRVCQPLNVSSCIWMHVKSVFHKLSVFIIQYARGTFYNETKTSETVFIINGLSYMFPIYDFCFKSQFTVSNLLLMFPIQVFLFPISFQCFQCTFFVSNCIISKKVLLESKITITDIKQAFNGF